MKYPCTEQKNNDVDTYQVAQEQLFRAKVRARKEKERDKGPRSQEQDRDGKATQKEQIQNDQEEYI